MNPRRLDRWLILTRSRLLAVVAAWFLAVVLHNVTYALFRDHWGPGGDEPVFFLLAVVVIPLYLACALVYTAIRRARA